MDEQKNVPQPASIGPVIFSFEGELLEAEIDEHNELKIGDIVSLVIEAKQYECRLIRQSGGRAYYFIPHAQYRGQQPLRQSPRVTVPLNGVVIERDAEYCVQLVDVSCMGMGFISKDNPLEIGKEYYIILDLPSNPLGCKILIMNLRPETGRYGASISFINFNEHQRLKQLLFLSLLTP